MSPLPPLSSASSSHKIADRYEILSKLGEGGMGVVFKCRDHKLQRIVALKQLSPNIHFDSTNLARFEQEVACLACLQHPNLVTLYEFQGRSNPYFVMEFIQGETLAEYIPDHKLKDFKQIANIFEQCARALYSVHQQGILHCDIKPSNIMMETSTQIPKIMDFGIAAIQNSQDNLPCCGTIGYMSLEHVTKWCLSSKNDTQHHTTTRPKASDFKLTAQSDIFSLGATMYHILAGCAPFPSQESQILFMPIIPLRKRNADVPPELEIICCKCLEDKPSKRYANAQDLADDLRRFQENRPILAKSPTLITHIYKWMSRYPGYGITALLLILTNFFIAIFCVNQALQADLANNESRQLAQQAIFSRQSSSQVQKQIQFTDKAIKNLESQKQNFQAEQSLIANEKQDMVCKSSQLKQQINDTEITYLSVQAEVTQSQEKIQEGLETLLHNQKSKDAQIAVLKFEQQKLENYLALVGSTEQQQKTTQEEVAEINIGDIEINEQTNLGNVFFPETLNNSSNQKQWYLDSDDATATNNQEAETVDSSKPQLVANIPSALYVGQTCKTEITYTNLSATNTFTNIVITASWAEKIKVTQAESGKIENNQVKWNLLSLGPHQSKTFTLNFTCLTIGKCSFTLAADNAQETIEKSYTLDIQDTQPNILVICPTSEVISNRLNVSIVVSNPTTMSLQNIPIAVNWDDPLTFSDGTDNPQVEKKSAQWKLASLKPNQIYTISLRLKSSKPDISTTLRVNRELDNISAHTIQWKKATSQTMTATVIAPKIFAVTWYSPEYFFVETHVENKNTEKIQNATVTLSCSANIAKMAGLLEYAGNSVSFPTQNLQTANPLVIPIGNLEPGVIRKFWAAVQPQTSGVAQFIAKVSSSQATAVGQATTEIRLLPKLGCSFYRKVSNTNMYVGDQMAYILQIQNLGYVETPAFQGNMTFTPESLQPMYIEPSDTAISGVIHANVDNQPTTVDFVCPAIPVGQVRTLCVSVKALQEGAAPINIVCNSVYMKKKIYKYQISVKPK